MLLRWQHIFQTLFAPGRDAEALEAGGQLLELQRHFRVSQAQKPFLSAYRSFKTE